MTENCAKEILGLSAKLASDGWDRLRGVRLIHAITAAMAEFNHSECLECMGRAEAALFILGEFIQESPSKERLAAVLCSVDNLASILLQGQQQDHPGQCDLPSIASEWTFIVLGQGFDPEDALWQALRAQGFRVKLFAKIDEAILAEALSSQVVFLAQVAWLAEYGDHLVRILPDGSSKRGGSPLLVAVADKNDFLSQIKARQLGARLLLNAPLDVHRLISELAGIAWVPRKPYRVLIVDDELSILGVHASMLRSAGFEVLAMDDPVAAKEFIDEFAPEVCVLDVEMPACRGTDLAAIFRRDKRFAHLPVIYLSAFSDLDHQLDARDAGGEDYLIKPVNVHLLVAAVLGRARQFRGFETVYRQRRSGWHQLENLRSALDAHAIVSVTSPDGSIVDVNRKFCEVSGYSREELIGRNHRIIKSGHHQPAFFEQMWQALSCASVWQGEVQNRHKDGSAYWVQSTIVPILDSRGHPEQYVSIRTEITEQKRVQDERAHQGRLLDAIRQSLQHFVVSHDLESSSELLLDAMLQLTGSTYGFIGEVAHEADGAVYLRPHAISVVSWSETPRQYRDEAGVPLMEFRDLGTLYGAVLRTGEHVISNDPSTDPRHGGLPDGHPPLEAFVGVPIRFGEALIGVAGLANRPDGYDLATVQFLAPLAAAYASILEADRLRNFQQQVIDDLQRTRDTLEQTSRAKLEFLSGWARDLRTPLNAILGHAQILLLDEHLGREVTEQVQEIIKGGDQFARQIREVLDRLNPNHGIFAPLVPLAQPMLSSDRDGVRRRILVAEDNPANQAVLRMQLDALGFDIDLAVDGTMALAKWQRGGHDLILADRHMPGMDGLALTRAIRATERESSAYVPIIAITAAHHPEELAACREAGMDDVLPKPIELDDLRRLLMRWLPRASPVHVVAEAVKPISGELGTTLDAGYLARIVGSTPSVEIRALVDLFTITAHAELASCHQLLESGDRHGLAWAMHKLKSSARMVGALRFAGLAENLEGAAKGGRLNAVAILLGELEHAVHDVEAAAIQIVQPSEANLAEARSLPAESLPQRILVIDDDPVARRQIGMLLAAMGIAEVLTVEGGTDALDELANTGNGFDLLITDLNMPIMDGIELLRRLAECQYKGDVILCSGVEDRLLQTAADLARAKGLSLRGALKKPMTREALTVLLTSVHEQPMFATSTLASVSISPFDIQQAIRRDEFSIHFQPKVDAATLRVVGVEALARWQRDGRHIAPSAFIGAAEQHGLIAPLSELLITKALIGGARLSEAGFPLTVAVNLSANWLSDIRLPEFIMATIQVTGFLAENLILEITETGIMADVAIALDVMTRLRLKGLKLSIDDFGTGYSSLEQLQRIPFGELKLDRNFVQGAAEKPATRAILASSLEMARKLKLSTVAEGVETQADLDLVRGLGCDLVQGWLIAKAMPLEVLIEWLRDRQARAELTETICERVSEARSGT